MRKTLVVFTCVSAFALGCAVAPRPSTQGPTASPGAPATATNDASTAAPTPVPTAVPTVVATPTIVPPTLAPVPTPSFTPGTTDAPRVVSVTADDALTFFPNVITVIEGETVTFNITNAGQAIHEFMVGPMSAAMGDVEGTPEVANIKGGRTKSLTFTFDGPGPFAFACHAPGHFEAGMLGYIVVVGPDVPKVGTAEAPRLIEVDMSDDLKFMPDQIGVAEGETVTFLVTNLGVTTHELAVGPMDKVYADQVDGTIVKEVDEITAHRLKTITYTFDGRGPYGFACHEPSHFEAGMKGVVIFTN